MHWGSWVLRLLYTVSIVALLLQPALPLIPVLTVGGDSIPWLQGWTHVGVLILHNPTDATVENYLMNISIDFSDQVAKGYVRTDLADVRFTDPDGNLLHFNYTGQDVYTGHFLVKFPVVKPGDNVYYIFYGNPGAYYPVYNDLDTGNKTITTTYMVEDDFSDPSTLSDYPASADIATEESANISDGYFTVTTGGSEDGGFKRIPVLPDGVTDIKAPVTVTVLASTYQIGPYISGDGDYWEIGEVYSSSYFYRVYGSNGNSHSSASIVSLSADYQIANVTLVYNGTAVIFYVNGTNVYSVAVSYTGVREVGIGYFTSDATTVKADYYKAVVTATGQPVTYTVLLEVAPGMETYTPTETPSVLNNTVNNTLKGHEIELPGWLSVHKDWVAIALSLTPLLLATEATAGAMALVSAGLLASFTAMGWVNASSGAVGVALFIAGAGVFISRKNP